MIKLLFNKFIQILIFKYVIKTSMMCTFVSIPCEYSSNIELTYNKYNGYIKINKLININEVMLNIAKLPDNARPNSDYVYSFKNNDNLKLIVRSDGYLQINILGEYELSDFNECISFKYPIK